MYKHAYKMYDHVLEMVENYEYLDIYISHNLKWDYHFECVSKKLVEYSVFYRET